MGVAPFAHADPGVAKSGIFSCTTAAGKRLRSDRPIAECANRPVDELNNDGSVRTTHAPTLTLAEKAEAEDRQRADDALRAARNEAVRRDRNLLALNRDEASHRKARDAALDEKRKSIDTAEKRLATLAAERKPLEDERQFYPGKKQLPLKLKLALDGNDATVAGTKDAIANQQSEIVRVNAKFDDELVRLKKLWAGAPLGSLGPMVASTSAATKGPAR